MSKRSIEQTETVIPLDAKKQVTVREYNNVKLVDIREFYVDKATEEKKPGKKGISLTEPLWKKLMENKDLIQEALDQLGDSKKQKTDEKKDDGSEKTTDKVSKKTNKKVKSEEFVVDDDTED